MKRLWLFLLFSTLSLKAIEIPQSEELNFQALPNGVVIGVQENSTPEGMISIRILSQNPLNHRNVYSLDCPYEDEEEMEEFFEMSLKELEDSSHEIAIFAVGDFPAEEMSALLKEQFKNLPQRERGEDKSSIEIIRKPHLQNTALTLTYAMPFAPLNTLSALKEHWRGYFFQHLFENRLKDSLKEGKGKSFGKKQTRSLFPRALFSVTAECQEENCFAVLCGFLMAAQELKEVGFTEEEFSQLKAGVQKQLFSSHRSTPDHATLVEYYVDSYPFEGGVCSAYDFFMRTSLNLIAEITLLEIHNSFETFLRDDQRQVVLQGPESLSLYPSQVQELLNFYGTDQLHLPPPEEAPEKPPIGDAYSLLVATESELEIIGKIVDTLATNNPISLGLKKSDLEKKGKKINHVHPLRFLGTILSDPHLKGCLRKIKGTYFQWNALFVEGLAPRLEQEAARHNVLPYISSFCQVVKANPEQVRVYVLKRDWDGMIKYLLKVE